MKARYILAAGLSALLLLVTGCGAAHSNTNISSSVLNSELQSSTSSTPVSSVSETTSSVFSSALVSGSINSTTKPNIKSSTEQKQAAAKTDSTILPNDSTGIPDNAFYKAILETSVGKNETVDQNKDGVLQRSEVQKIPKAVNWDNKGIQSIQGIEILPVFEIHLNGNKISDISPVAKLAGTIKTGEDELTVELKSNKVASLKSFGTLIAKLKSSHVKSLDLSNNLISDVSSIKDIDIATLILNHNKIVTADSFLLNNQSFYLDLSYNQIQSLGNCNFLAYSINLSHNKISTIKSFSSSADELNLSDNVLTDVSFLKGVKAPGPSKLNLSYNELYSLPDMTKWGWTKLKPDRDGKQYAVQFDGNHLSQKELQTKLPDQFFSGESANNSKNWLTDQVSAQLKD
jgi:hypothetical protein